jgi:hypothetical protein
MKPSCWRWAPEASADGLGADGAPHVVGGPVELGVAVAETVTTDAPGKPSTLPCGSANGEAAKVPRPAAAGLVRQGPIAVPAPAIYSRFTGNCLRRGDTGAYAPDWSTHLTSLSHGCLV